MDDKMLTLKELENIIWKRERTLRRVVKNADNQIRTSYKNTKLVANLDDVLNHYWMTDQKSYPNSNQPESHVSEPSNSNFRRDSQVVNPQANQDFIKSINSLVKQITEVTKENTDIQKSLVLKEKEFWTQLLSLEYKYQKENLAVEREHDQKIQAMKDQQAKKNVLVRLVIYILLATVVVLVGYYLISGYMNHWTLTKSKIIELYKLFSIIFLSNKV